MNESQPAGDWTRCLRNCAPMRVAIVGAAGRLGASLGRVLTDCGHQVLAIDRRPPGLLTRQEYAHFDLCGNASLPASLLRGCGAVVHLAALHGAHLVAGTPRRDFWSANVHGTQIVLEAALEAQVPRFVFASSTSIHGSGTPEGPAKVIDEQTPLKPEDVYDLTKVAGERLIQLARQRGSDAVALRFGRFYSPGYVDYQMRKLSSGLDVHDACQAVVRVLLAPVLPAPAYCVASDLPLTSEQRADLGVAAVDVLRAVLPGFVESAKRRGARIPARVGKSVCSSLIRRDLGYTPERALDWVARIWAERAPQQQSQRHIRRSMPITTTAAAEWGYM